VKKSYINNKSYIFIFFILLASIQILNFYNFNIYNLSPHFSDLKWSGAKLFLEGENIYEIFNSNNYDDKIIKSQFPNYSIGSIYFHLPLGYFNMRLATIIWSVIIFVLIFHCYLIFQNKDFGIRNQKKIILFSFIFFICSKPFNLLISNGNLSIVCFWALINYFLNTEKFKLFSLLIIFIKYSFAPIIFLYLLLKKKYILILLVLTINICLIIHYSTKFNYEILYLILDPIKIGELTSASGFYDFQTLMGNYPKNSFLRYFLIIIFSFFLYYKIFQNTLRDNLFDLCLVSILTLLFYKHLYYDQILLLPILIYSFKIDLKNRITIIIIIIYFWIIPNLEFLDKIEYWKSFMLFNNILTSITLFLIYKSNEKNKKN